MLDHIKEDLKEKLEVMYNLMLSPYHFTYSTQYFDESEIKSHQIVYVDNPKTEMLYVEYNDGTKRYFINPLDIEDFKLLIHND